MIKKNQHIEPPAERKEVKGTNGWNAVVGDAISSTTPPYVAMLLSMVGFGKVASVRVNISDDQFEAEVEKFWTNMQMVEVVSSETPSTQTITPTGAGASVLATGKGSASVTGVWRSACNDKTDISTVTNASGTGYAYWSMSTGGLRVRHMALLDNGIVNSYVGLYGFTDVKTDRLKDPNIWGIYQYENGKGTIKFDGISSTYPIVVQNGKLQYDGCVFERLPWIEDLRLNATYTWESNPAQYKANGMNAEPTIRFSTDGRFSDIGAVYYLNHIKHGYNTDYSDNKYGDGRYEIKHYTLSLFFDDGRIYHYTYENFDGNVSNPTEIGVGLKYLTRK